MSSLYSDHSTPKCQNKKSLNLYQIHHKTIDKQKRQTLKTRKKSEQSINLASQNNGKLRHLTYNISQIKSKDQVIGSIENNLIRLGRLHIDELTIHNKILERKITSDFVESKISPTNYNDEDNGLSNQYSFYKNELLELYNSLSVLPYQSNERMKYEDSLSQPYECLTYSFHNGKLIKISKKWNYDYLRMMGITYEIIDDYICNHNLLPKCCDLINIFPLNRGTQQTINIINYQGEEFFSNINIKTFIEYNKSTQITEQMTFVSFQCERQFLSAEKLLRNFKHYFNLQQISSDQQLSILKSRIHQRCSFRKKSYLEI